MRTYDNKRGELASKGMVAEEGGNKWQKGPRKVAKSRVSLPEKKSSMQVSDQGNGRESGGQELIPSNTVTKKEGRDAGVPRKRMPREQFEQSTEGDGGERNRKRRKRSEPIGRDVTDKLDKLIEQYSTNSPEAVLPNLVAKSKAPRVLKDGFSHNSVCLAVL